MSDGSHIQWTDATWPVVAGCEKVSAGCRGCYAIRDSWRLSHHPNPKVSEAYAGTVEKSAGGKLNWTGFVRPLPQRLDWPLRWRKPRMIFVCNEADLFHEAVPFDFIARVWQTMRLTPQHTYQILTKRPERMAEFLTGCRSWSGFVTHNGGPPEGYWRPGDSPEPGIFVGGDNAWPLPNVWLGTSVEDQDAADERIPHLLRIPAAVRFLSCEPLLGDLDIRRWLGGTDVVRQHRSYGPVTFRPRDGVSWVILGGESGPSARPMDLAWARSIVDQCRATGVATFVKQMGRWILGDHEGFEVNHWLLDDGRGFIPPIIGPHVWKRPANAIGFHLFDAKGGNPDEWPADLRVREFPAPAAVRTCRVCGCTDFDCRGCVERTGARCSWVESDLCSACVPAGVVG